MQRYSLFQSCCNGSSHGVIWVLSFGNHDYNRLKQTSIILYYAKKSWPCHSNTSAIDGFEARCKSKVAKNPLLVVKMFGSKEK
jgi:hypothetical protein